LKGGSDKMNIAVINEFFPPKVTGGTEIFLSELSKHLKSRGFGITVITTEQGQKENHNFKVYKIKSSPVHFSHRYQFHGITIPWMFFSQCLKKKLAAIYKKEGIDMLYVNNMFHLSFAPVQNSLPFVLDVHDYWPVCFSKDLYYNDRSICSGPNDLKCSFCLSGKSRMPLMFNLPMLSFERYWKRRLLLRSEKTICHSNFVSSILKGQGYENEIIPYPYMGPFLLHDHGIGKEFKILFAGRVERRKGAHLLLDVAKKLHGKMHFRIDVIGDGPLKKMLDRKDLNIYVHGFLGNERFRYFREADCLLAPSLWPEPFGIVAVEAMAFGVPVITLDNGGLAEVVRENETGIIITEERIAESILELSENKKLSEKIRKNGEKNIKKYDKERIFKEYEKIFTSVME
jgi:glycosyltransferase involved in cell wall biosynthesis